MRKTQILHSVELAGIRVALAENGILKSWQWELEVVSNNSFMEPETQRISTRLRRLLWGNQSKSFAIEFERTLKGSARYEGIVPRNCCGKRPQTRCCI